MKKRAVFVMYEGGLLNSAGENGVQHEANSLAFVPGAIGGLALLARQKAHDLILLFNKESSPSRDAQTDVTELPLILSVLQGEGVVFAERLAAQAILDDLEGFCLLRGYDPHESFLVTNVSETSPMVSTSQVQMRVVDLVQGVTWAHVAQSIVASARSSRVKRITTETSIDLDLSLASGLGVSVCTGLGFFDHMLTLLFVHAGYSATLRAVGDLHVDEHHLVEDVGLVTGQAIREALGDKRGISRYGFLLPMDESLAEIALDLAGRYEFVWDVTWTRERIGDMPTELIRHFFKSLAESLRCCLHMSVRGEDQHHKAEALFKGVGRTLRTACACEVDSTEIPSSKGVL